MSAYTRYHPYSRPAPSSATPFSRRETQRKWLHSAITNAIPHTHVHPLPSRAFQLRDKDPAPVLLNQFQTELRTHNIQSTIPTFDRSAQKWVDWDHPTTEQINGTKRFLAPSGIRNLPESKLPLCPHAGNPHRTNTECRMTFHHHRHESGQISYLQADEKYHHCPFIIILRQRESMKGEKDDKALSLASSRTSVPVKHEDKTKIKVEHKIKPERTPGRNPPKPSLPLFTHAPLSSHPLTKSSRRSNAALTSPPFSSFRQIEIKSEPRVLEYLPSSSSRPMQIKTEITILDSPPSSPVPGPSNNSPPHPPSSSPPQSPSPLSSPSRLPRPTPRRSTRQLVTKSKSAYTAVEAELHLHPADAKGHFLYDEKSADFPPEFFRYRNVDNNAFANRIFDASVFTATISGKLLRSLTRTHGAAATSWNNFVGLIISCTQCSLRFTLDGYNAHLILSTDHSHWCCGNNPKHGAAPRIPTPSYHTGLALLALNSRLGLPQLHWEAVKAGIKICSECDYARTIHAHEAHLDAGRCSDFAVTGGGVICTGHGTGKMLGANSKTFREVIMVDGDD
ncbi:hypothetical protein C8R44DRAFT_736180 [Mycena epipterygia]|nr:hypothetical protein C8R44DRAFT_736180 [Mycena epipterygia]